MQSESKTTSAHRLSVLLTKMVDGWWNAIKDLPYELRYEIIQDLIDRSQDPETMRTSIRIIDGKFFYPESLS